VKLMILEIIENGYECDLKEIEWGENNGCNLGKNLRMDEKERSVFFG